jgi:hypothetical protein
VYRRTTKRPQISSGDRILWSWLSRRWTGWRDALFFVQTGILEQMLPMVAAAAMGMMSKQSAAVGNDGSATQYFRTNTEGALAEKMRPIVEQATARTGVTSAYKNMMASAGGLTSILTSDATDLDGYVTGKTLDGLFLMIAEEEKKIRENPVARSTDLLKKVFGAYE